MAKWDADKLAKALEKADKKGSEPPVPVRTDPESKPRMSKEEKLRRYEKG